MKKKSINIQNINLFGLYTIYYVQYNKYKIIKLYGNIKFVLSTRNNIRSV